MSNKILTQNKITEHDVPQHQLVSQCKLRKNGASLLCDTGNAASQVMHLSNSK
jgi:hypothetical protein